jgi:hypothetical protein
MRAPQPRLSWVAISHQKRVNFVTPIPAALIHSGLNAAGYPVEVEKAK